VNKKEYFVVAKSTHDHLTSVCPDLVGKCRELRWIELGLGEHMHIWLALPHQQRIKLWD